MTWLKIDDGFCTHPKIAELTHQAFRLHVSALCLCARDLTDGRITDRSLRSLAAGLGISGSRYAQELVEARLWIPQPKGGWKVKDYLEYNPSSVRVKERRERNAARQQAFRRRNSESNALRNGATNDAPSPTRISKEQPQALVPKDVTSTVDAERIEQLHNVVEGSFGRIA